MRRETELRGMSGGEREGEEEVLMIETEEEEEGI